MRQWNEVLLSMNVTSFQDLVKGRYGRKIAYTEHESITRDNIMQVIGETIGVFNYNKPVIKYLWDYFRGDQPIRYRTKLVRDDIVNRIVENHAYEIVEFKTGQTYGEPLQFISRKDDDAINRAVDELNNLMIDANKQEKDIKAGEWQSATGTAFKAVQFAPDSSDIPFNIIAPTPMNTYVVYNHSTEEPILAVQELKDVKGRWYKLCYTDTHTCKIVNGRVAGWTLHAFGGIPIVEYPNNHERISDIELVIDILDALNMMQANRMDAVEQFVQSWVKFVNCDVDEETFNQMKMQGALVVRSNNGTDNKADVDIMTQELNQTQTQVAKDDLWENAEEILAIPKLEGNTGGDTQGAVELRNGWDASRNRTVIKDPIVKSAEKRLAKIVLNILRIKDNDLGITARDFDVQINHSPTDNMVVKCQSLQYLLECGVNPMVAIKTVGLWGDAEKVFLLSQPYLDNKYKTVDDEQVSEGIEVESDKRI